MEGKVNCKICGKGYANDGYILKRHIERTHFGNTNFPAIKRRKGLTRNSTKSREKRCDECDFVTDKYDLKYHKQSKHGNIKFPCNICDYQGKSERMLYLHKRGTHSRKRYSCELRPYKTQGKGSFQHHVDMKHNNGVAIKRYSCNLCEATFVHSKSIDQHVKIIHEEGFRLKCDICQKEFTQKIHLQEHVVSVHLKTKDHRMWKNILIKILLE